MELKNLNIIIILEIDNELTPKTWKEKNLLIPNLIKRSFYQKNKISYVEIKLTVKLRSKIDYK